MLNKGHSLYTLQCNELNWGHQTLISQSHLSRLQQRSLALVVGKPIKNENISLTFKVSVLSVAPVEFVAL